MTNCKKFYKELREKVAQLQNEKQFQGFVEWNYKFTRKNIKILKAQIEKSQRLFYSYMHLLWEKNVPKECDFHFPGQTLKMKKFQVNYELIDDIKFLITLNKDDSDEYFGKLIENKDQFSSYFLPLFLSPLSINYFHKSLYKIMLPLYTSQQDQYLDDFEFLNNLQGSISTSLFQNLCYLPEYLYELLTKEDAFFKDFESPKIVIRKFALNIFFLRPDLIGIEATEEQINKVFKKLNNLLDQVADIFLATINTDNTDFSTQCIELLTDVDDDTDAFNSTTVDNDFKYYFRQLLKISPKLPATLPKELANTKNYEDIVKKLVVRPGPQYLKRYKFFQKLESYQVGNKNRLYQEVSKLPFKHETEEIAKLSSLNVQLSNIQKITVKVIDNCKKMCLCVLKVDNMGNDLDRYIEEPQTLVKNTQNLEEFYKKERVFTSIYSPDNIYKYLVKVIRFNSFIEQRKDILTSDRSLETILESFKNRKFDITALYDFQEQNKREFNNLRNLFVEAFCESNDPLTKAKKISHAYANIVKKVKLHIGVDVDSMNEDERNTFILSVFCLFMPTKVISVYVFLTEFVFHSSYNVIFASDLFKNDLEDINLAKSVLKSLISTCSNLSNLNGMTSFCPNFIYQCVNLSRICQENVNLKVKRSNEECEKLAIMSNPDYSMGNKAYDEYDVNDHNTKSLIIFFQKINCKKNIILRIYEDENKIYVCNVSLLNDEQIDPLPKDRTELIKYIQELSKKNQALKPK